MKKHLDYESILSKITHPNKTNKTKKNPSIHAAVSIKQAKTLKKGYLVTFHFTS